MGRTDSLKRIAEMTGLSVPTVVQVLGSRGHRYREETRQRVIDAAEAVGYRPNAAAKALNRGRFGSAAILCGANPWLNLLPQLLVDGIMDELGARNMHLSMARLSDDKLTTESELPKVLREWMADGLLINYNTEIPGPMMELVRKFHLPSIWINSKHQHDCVHPDDYGAGRHATQQLLKLGHRHIAYADYSRALLDPTLHQIHYSSLDRIAGYRDAMAEANLPTCEILTTENVTEQNRIAFSINWLKQSNRPTAVIGNGMNIAMAIWQAALTLQISVPKEMSIVTFGPGSYGDTHMGLTTWIVPEYQEGRDAVTLLCQKIKQPQVLLEPVAIPFDCVREGLTLATAPVV